MTAVRPLAAADLVLVRERASDAFSTLNGAHLFMSGVTGFVGGWLLETLLDARRALGLDVRVTVLVRDAARFRGVMPHLAGAPDLTVHEGDVRRFASLDGAVTHVVHAASAATPAQNRDDPDGVVDMIEAGTARVMEEAARSAATHVLLISSGSVYVSGAGDSGSVTEDAETRRADVGQGTARFGAAKRRAEEIATSRAAAPAAVIARIFALVGPRLPLNGQFAIGQFLGDAMAGRPVRVSSDGSPVRTYLYMADLAAWCWTLLVRGTPGRAYNVGGADQWCVRDVAGLIAQLPTPPVSVTIGNATDANAPTRYVPDIRRAQDELALAAWTSLDESLARTWRYLHRANG